jgi:VIT1/CCC1 family predicted Fe2+/Mn2+ transporter
MAMPFSKKLIGIKAERLRDEIFGATDGTISTLAVIAGVYGATNNNFLILVAGFSAMLAEAISMGFSSYSGALIREDITKKKVHRPLSEGVVFWLATMGGGFIPIVPFLIPQISHIAASIIFSTLFLFAVGAYAAKSIGNNVIMTGARTAAIGLIAAIITYYVGVGFAQIAPMFV